MSAADFSLDFRLSIAVRHFWQTRVRQASVQGSLNDRDIGSRAAVTGGRQMDGFVNLVRDLLTERGCPADSIHTSARLELPGWFRSEKKWDLVVVHRSQLIAAVEFKSHIGPSFGNNFNNRTEEALGSASDVWAAYREGAFKPSARPWLGYLMLLEKCDNSSKPVKVSEPHFKVFPEFRDASYRDRYRILIQKLLRERLYDGACYLLSPLDAGSTGQCEQPDPELSFEVFVRGLLARVSEMVR